MRRVERERARTHLGHADTAIDAGQAPRKQPVAALQRVDDDDVIGQAERDLQRVGQPPLQTSLDQQPIDHHVDRVVLPPVEPDLVLEAAKLTIDARAREAARPQGGQLLLELALPAAHDRRQHVDALVRRVQSHHVDDALERLRRDLLAALGTVRHADVGEQQPEIVVDLGDRAHGRSRVRPRGLLFDRDRGRQAFDEIDVGLLHLLEKLAGVRRQRLDVSALAFRVDRVERQRRLARARQPRDDHELVARDVDVDILQIVDAGSAHRDPVVGHECGAFSGPCPLTGISGRPQTPDPTTSPPALARWPASRRIAREPKAQRRWSSLNNLRDSGGQRVRSPMSIDVPDGCGDSRKSHRARARPRASTRIAAR